MVLYILLNIIFLKIPIHKYIFQSVQGDRSTIPLQGDPEKCLSTALRSARLPPVKI